MALAGAPVLLIRSEYLHVNDANPNESSQNGPISIQEGQ
jgi:hypothetical protein